MLRFDDPTRKADFKAAMRHVWFDAAWALRAQAAGDAPSGCGPCPHRVRERCPYTAIRACIGQAEALLLTAAALRKLSDSYRALFLSGYGGNAFLMTASCREESAEVLVQRFTDLLERDPAVSGLPFRFTGNIGYAIAAEGGMTVEELAGEAGHALCGKRGCCMKSRRMARERASLIRRCRRKPQEASIPSESRRKRTLRITRHDRRDGVREKERT